MANVTPPISTCGVSPLGGVTDQDQATHHIEHSIYINAKPKHNIIGVQTKHSLSCKRKHNV
ncbi:hypothetical protein HanRHA438_Chr13g0622821 [Helianthus annuus]|nr:hypothetical protein HanRHA438_Chr13g0622821 [Helianthus annuus]